MNEILLHKIVTLYQGGASVRQISLSLGISRRTVKRALERVEHARRGVMEESPGRRRRGSQLDAYEPMITELLARYPDMKVQRIHEELRRAGYTGSYTILCVRVRALRPRALRPPVQRFETAPGEQAQMDYSTYDLDFSAEGRRRVHAFSYVLGYSRRQYLHFVEYQDLATTIRQHIRAFEHMGGVAAVCLYDNMKVVVSGFEGGEPVYNPKFLGFAAHYGFRPVACRPRRPQTKGKVERPFGYVESSLLNGRSFRSLEHLNDVAAWWLAEVADVHAHRQTKARPIDRHAEEQPRLIPLPAHPYDACDVVYRVVDAMGDVVYRQNLYSVPWSFIGQMVAVRATEDQVIIHDRAFVELARHKLVPRGMSGQRSHYKEHDPPRDAKQRLEHLAERFAQFGPEGTRFLEGLMKLSRCGKSQAERVLSLLAAYQRSDVVSALARAARYGAFTLAAIQRILVAQGRPKTPFDALADGHQSYLKSLSDSPPAPPRPTSEYQELLGEGTDDAETNDPDPSANTGEDRPEDGSSGSPVPA
jgi:transposase